MEKAVSSSELFQQAYPRDSSAHNSLGNLYGRLGNHEKAEEESREALRLNPNAAVYYQNLGANLVSLNRLDEAEAVYKLSDERNLPYVGTTQVALSAGVSERRPGADGAVGCFRRRESGARKMRCWARRRTPRHGTGD